MTWITGRRIVGALAVAGVAGVLGRGAARHLLAHHNDLFVGAGSEWYDRLAPHLLGRLYRRVADDITAMYRAGVVLDVGCGPGHLVLDVARRAPGLDVRGVDVSADMVSLATRNAIRTGLAGRVRFEVSEPARLPYADASVDLVVSTMSMHHWTDAPGMLRELARVVRPGGQVWIYDVWQPAMSPDGPAAAVPDGSFGAPHIEHLSLKLGPIPIPHMVRCTLERQ